MSYGFVGSSGIERVELGRLAVDGIRRRVVRRRLGVVLRQEAEEVAGVLERSLLVRRDVRCATPDFVACVIAPPSSSNVTSSPVTVFTTSGPVMNMYDVPSTMRTKSVMAGE